MKDNNKEHNGQTDDSLGRILAMAAGFTPAGGPCPTPEQIAALMDGGLGKAERDAVLGHLAGCDACRQALLTAVRLSAPDQTPATHTGRRFGFLVPYAAAAAVVIAAVSAALVYRGYILPSRMQVARQYEPAEETRSEPQKTESTARQVQPEVGMDKKKTAPTPAPAQPREALDMSDMPQVGERGALLKQDGSLGRAGVSVNKAAKRRADAAPPSPQGLKHNKMGFSEPSAGAGEPPGPVKEAAPALTFSNAKPRAVDKGTATEKPQTVEPECAPAEGGGPAICKLPPDKAEAGAAISEKTAEVQEQAKSEVVKEKGTIISLDPSKGELEFLPEGEKESVLVEVAKPLLEGLHAGDKVLVVYEKSLTNTATRIKKERAIIVPVGC